ncbi:hypothetical protein K8R78_03465 [bacterium]|nr:hypothetical protein [bacterium]
MKQTRLPLTLLSLLLLSLLSLLATACGESDYKSLTDYQQPVSAPDALLQESVDEYNGTVLAVGQGCGIRLPMDSWRAERLLTKATEAWDELALVAIPEVAATVGELKLAAAEAITAAAEELLIVVSLWEERVPVGPPDMTNGAELKYVELSLEEVHQLDTHLAQVEELFQTAAKQLENGALALAGALLKSRGE